MREKGGIGGRAGKLVKRVLRPVFREHRIALVHMSERGERLS